ncbi:cofilin/tropomyosin-type actin-binding domain-containing protein [Rhizoctonia solani AG-1 IA]|uniref:Cofilin n=1 Tax=Thanatephorus cucumeris (strain AG1-IA) TaxID=983506 RepID=L8WQA2_THACA|nr:cofilin/tropomyosin-type actin-binding domain-containing protein [Rhizoctonia solani AG-1 IA]
MASRLGIRLATRSLRQPVARVQLGRRAMSSFATILGGGDKAAHHASKPKASAKEEPKEEHKEKSSSKGAPQKSDDNEAGADNVDGSVSPAEVQESIKQSIKVDEPSTAKAEEAKSSGPPKKSTDSGSESGDDEYVKVENISAKDTQEALAQSEKADVPAIAKPTEEKEARSKSGSHVSSHRLGHIGTNEPWGDFDLADSSYIGTTPALDAYQELKLGKKKKYVIFKLSEDMKQIVVDKTSDDPSYETFVKDLPEDEPRWAVYDVQYEKSGAGQRNKLTFFSWNPDSATIKKKMVYSSSKEAIRKSLDGIAAEIQGTALDEVSWEAVLEKVSRGY